MLRARVSEGGDRGNRGGCGVDGSEGVRMWNRAFGNEQGSCGIGSSAQGMLHTSTGHSDEGCFGPPREADRSKSVNKSRQAQFTFPRCMRTVSSASSIASRVASLARCRAVVNSLRASE
jgi:hypothetical protein